MQTIDRGSLLDSPLSGHNDSRKLLAGPCSISIECSLDGCHVRARVDIVPANNGPSSPGPMRLSEPCGLEAGL